MATFILMPSYVFQGYFNIDVRNLFVVIALISFFLIFSSKKILINREILNLIFLLLLIGSIGTIFSGKSSQILMVTCLSICVLIISSGWDFFTDKKALYFQILLSYILTSTSIIGFLYAISGGESSQTVVLQGGREVFYYLTTFTNSVVGNLIRPAGIFDEPGALAMFITLVVSLNEMLGGDRKHSYFLLLSGLVTGSFILFLITILFFVYRGNLKYLIYLFLSFVIYIVVLRDSFFTDIIDTFFLSRINVIEFTDGKLFGDSRSVQVYEFFDIVNWDMTLRGVEDRTDSIDQSSNPFSIYYGYGIFVWIPYILLEFWLLYASFFYVKKVRFPALIIFLTLLQRPYIYNLYWCFMITLAVFSIYKIQNKTPSNLNVLDS